MSLSYIVFLYLLVYVSCQDRINVMKTSNVSFPYSGVYPALLNASYSKPIAEFTLCYRFYVESYNDGFMYMLNPKTPDWGDHYYYEAIGWDTGYEKDGFQGARSFIKRNVEGGGLVNRQLPRYAYFVLARNIDTSKWTHWCTTYSSTLKRLVRYQNGQKVHGVQFKDEKEDPLPSDFFGITQIARNLRGLFTDLNIYSSYFDTDALISWTTACNHKGGEIYAWDTTKLNLSQKMDVSIISMDRKDVCPDPNQQDAIQKPRKTAKKSKTKRFQPKLPATATFIGSVLELITSPDRKSYADGQDMCFRLGGEIMMYPQNKEEMDMFDSVLWDYLMQKTGNNMSVLDDIIAQGGEKPWEANARTLVGGLTEDMNKQGTSNDIRESFYPDNGTVGLVHPWTGEFLHTYGHGTIYWPLGVAGFRDQRYNIQCFNSMRKALPGTYWWDRVIPLCWTELAEGKEWGQPICTFSKNPTFTVRGLCKDAVMDTQFKLSSHSVGPIIPEESESRSYVGPKGWRISRGEKDGKWRMSHYHYTDLTLTMLDTDVLPFGRHKWMVENNVCNEGVTSSQVLQISGCNEQQFTCDDGKCIDLSQRCNNIEVNM